MQWLVIQTSVWLVFCLLLTRQLSQSTLLNAELYPASFLWCALWVGAFIETSRWTRVQNILGIWVGVTILGACAGLSSLSRSPFGLFLFMFCFFHFSEFALISFAHRNPRFDSLLLNHGSKYASAFTFSVIEFLLSPFTLSPLVRLVGMVTAMIGLLLRAMALWTAGSAFTHLIVTRRSSMHTLVTTGVYAFMRHPGYAGWLLWVCGAQLLAGNLVSFVCFSIVTWIFFKDRIEYEETLLLDMFGNEYRRYKQRTRFSGVPWIQ